MNLQVEFSNCFKRYQTCRCECRCVYKQACNTNEVDRYDTCEDRTQSRQVHTCVLTNNAIESAKLVAVEISESSPTSQSTKLHEGYRHRLRVETNQREPREKARLETARTEKPTQREDEHRLQHSTNSGIEVEQANTLTQLQCDDSLRKGNSPESGRSVRTSRQNGHHLGKNIIKNTRPKAMAPNNGETDRRGGDEGLA